MDSGGEEPEKSSNSLEPPLKDANDLEMNEVYCQNDDIDYRDGIGANPLTTSEVMDITLETLIMLLIWRRASKIFQLVH